MNKTGFLQKRTNTSSSRLPLTDLRMLNSKKANIRVPNRLGFPDQSFEELWAALQDAIDCIYENNVSGLSFEKLYRTIYTIVLRKKSSDLYNKLGDYLAKKLDKLKKEQFHEVQGFELLTKVMQVWESQCNCFKLISDVMIYMDKVYCKPERKLETYDLGLEIFKLNVVKPLEKAINKAMIHDVNEVRQKLFLDVSHTEVWKGIIGMMETLEDERDNYFSTQFEPVLLSETERYYTHSINCDYLTPIEYLESMKKLKYFEYTLDSQFLNTDSTAKITTVLEKVLIWNQKFVDVLPLLVRESINESNINLLKELSALSSENNYGLNILNCIKNCIFEDANAVVIDTTSRKRAQVATKWTKNVIELFNQYEGFLRHIDLQHISLGNDNVEGDLINSKILNDVFSKYLNQNGKQSVEFITLYLDSCLKLTQNKQEVEKAKNDLEACVKLFRILSEKDVFEKFYKQQLSKRLLQHKSMVEMERWMIKRIKDEMGTFFTSKLDGMLRDMVTSSELLRSFRTNRSNDDPSSELDFRPQILTMTSWPFQSAFVTDGDIFLPSRLEHLRLDFETFYTKKYPERSLQWASHLGYMEIGFQFDSNYHDISMPIYAATIFLLFEQYDELTMEMIGDLTNISEQELHRQLISLAVAPKSRILKKRPMSRSISAQDKFSINYAFTAPTAKVKVQTIAGLVPSSKTDSNLSSAQDSAERERSIEINAAIVRIMKSHRKLSHGKLMTMVADVVRTRYPLSSTTFKKSINYLLEKEYILRDPDDLSIYHYIS